MGYLLAGRGLPTIVVATAFTSLLGPKGWVNQILKGFPVRESDPEPLPRGVPVKKEKSELFFDYLTVRTEISN